MATENEIYRYYEILAYIKDGKFIEKLPFVDRFNGVDRTQAIYMFESYKNWDFNSRYITAKQVKEELPILEEKFKKLKENYYSEIKKKEEEDKKLREKEMFEEIKDFIIIFNNDIKVKIGPGMYMYPRPNNWSSEKLNRYIYFNPFINKWVNKKLSHKEFTKLMFNYYKLSPTS
jgi:hypothetical protein